MAQATLETKATRDLGSLTIPITTETPLDYSLIPVSKDHRDFFPGYKKDFTIKSNVGDLTAHVTSAPRGNKVGDPEAGSYICGGLRQWYDANKVKVGDEIVIRQLERHEVYRIRKR